MPLVYMNSWASLALRAGALGAFAPVAMAGGFDAAPRATLAALALLLAASAAHPLSVALRLGGGATVGLLAAAEGALALALAAMFAHAAALEPSDAVRAGALAAPLALALAAVALAGGIAQHDRLARTHGGRWPALPVAIAAGSAGVALLAALQAEAAAHGPVPALGATALLLAAWIMRSALRLRRARRSAARARLRDQALASPPTGSVRRLGPATQWS
ncbi:MAG: hypothetical protein RJA99_4123 [Pseudomonadota bacterium]|jgi:hypothetical protein